jgi:hypothetical protein
MNSARARSMMSLNPTFLCSIDLAEACMPMPHTQHLYLLTHHQSPKVGAYYIGSLGCLGARWSQHFALSPLWSARQCERPSGGRDVATSRPPHAHRHPSTSGSMWLCLSASRCPRPQCLSCSPSPTSGGRTDTFAQYLTYTPRAPRT